MTRWRYAAVFGAAVMLLGVVAAYLLSLSRTPLAPASRPGGVAIPQESAVEFTIGDPTLIRPDAGAYQRFAAEDAAWRATHAPPISRGRSAVAGGEWSPTPRQRVRDSVFTLTQNGRPAEAIALLERWVDRNPQDAEQLLELARLLNQAGRADESLARYRQLLGLQRPRSP